jgi:hypothetical protein
MGVSVFGINDALRDGESVSGEVRVAVIGAGAMGRPGPACDQTRRSGREMRIWSAGVGRIGAFHAEAIEGLKGGRS